MRIAACATLVLLAAALFGARVGGQDTKGHCAEEKQMFATNRGWPKGGLGIVNTGLYIVLESSKNDSNELIVKPTEESEQRWKGKNVTTAEIVFVYEAKVWEQQKLPKGFDLSKAVVVSFEGDKIRFFDFQAMSGGYYERIKD